MIKLYGIYRRNNSFELAFEGDYKTCSIIGNHKIYNAKSLNEETLDYDNDAFIVSFKSGIEINASQIEVSKKFYVSKLKKEFKKINIAINDRCIKISN